MALPGVSWTIDGLDTPLTGWSATTIAFGGFAQMRGTMRESDARRLPSVIGQGSIVRGYSAGGFVIWEGRLSAPPAIRGGLATFAAQGESVRAAKRSSRLLYQSRDYSKWVPAGPPPHVYTIIGENRVQMRIDANRLLFVLNDGEAMQVGDEANAAFWTPNMFPRRIQCSWKSDRNASALMRIDFHRATGPAGTQTAIQTNALSGTSGTLDTGLFDNPGDQVHTRFVIATGFTSTPTFQLQLTDLRVNGIAPTDTFTGSEVVDHVGRNLGYDTTGVFGSGLNVLPQDWMGPWAELLSYIATLEDRYWRITEDRGLGPYQEYNTWGTKEWTVYQADGATVDLQPLELYNQATVYYTDVGGAPRQKTVTCADLGLHDPLAAKGIINDWPESLSDVQPNADLATAVANNIVPRVCALREQGRIDCVRAYDSTGREAVREIRAGDTVRVADRDMNTATLHRVFETDQNDNVVSLGIESGVSIASMLARAGLVGARAPSTVQLPELPPPGPPELGEPGEVDQRRARLAGAFRANPALAQRYKELGW